ncbi:curved DNA-binding protein [Echria macrotheca]|uniref:Curved DNA-binding protein n=1 Tax=Echria macrotheca TaxID=438768 RepID=A0AAJ0BF09_9PEZI|nr:curved DNA-binding protein [Echria macrotheca]
MATEEKEIDYSLNNPDTLTKYKTAAQISEKVLAEVSKLCVAGEKIISICEKGDKLIEEEIAKVYRGKKITKGFSHPTTVSPAAFVTPYTPIAGDEKEAATELQPGEPVKIQLGAQIDGFGSIVCDTILAPTKDKAEDVVTGRPADLMLATYYANELLLRLMIPPGLLATGTDEEKAKAAAAKAPTQAKITSLLEKVAKAYDCNLVESTTSWLFDRNEIEGKKKIVISPGEGTKGEGSPEVGEVWGVEMGVSLGSGKVKQFENRTTLHRRTTQTYALKRPSSRKILSEVQKKFGTFPFSLRQLEDERDAKSGVIECVRGNVFRQYEVVGDKDNSPVARLLTTIAITKNGITKLGAPPALDLSKYKSDKKIEDEEILKILEQPLSRNTGKAKNKKKKKPAKKAAKEESESEEDSDDE